MVLLRLGFLREPERPPEFPKLLPSREIPKLGAKAITMSQGKVKIVDTKPIFLMMSTVKSRPKYDQTRVTLHILSPMDSANHPHLR